ncbi:cysteine hydrolase family protein [Pseudomonas sp. sp1636]|uniref:cysteine hydrolase family protein n=1 Tax=Pseudomonas sp. sp1636 TaxID=3036707 RepID=UPI0025A56B9E|nr:cysteine hydrolase family protein [Pseudomonas sp. sp1636]MDM8349348.1 cysteine hydrolase family protein [Pseudomonas sp. sp1636]
MPNPAAKRPALLIVDMQVGLFHGPERPYQGQRVLANINRLIGKARSADAPIFAARHSGPAGSPIEPGSPLWQLLPELEVEAATDWLFDKTRPSCFFATDLAERLASAGVDRLVIAGMKTQYCIDSTCRMAAELGLQPVLVADAHTCMDTPVASAQTIIEHHNLTLGGPFVQLLSTDELQFGSPARMP